MHVTLFQPEIAGNVGAVMRSCACFGAGLTLIEPCGFPVGDKRMRRAAMDYNVPGGVQTSLNWETYQKTPRTGRLVLLTTQGATPLPAFDFAPEDTFLFGAEGSGVPDFVHAAADARIVIPMAVGARSLNLSVSVAVTLFEALRQTGGLP
jgi:tRNA (cytidine/uridine-2'-O-)-methyltransferase